MSQLIGQSRQELSDFVNAHTQPWSDHTAGVGLPAGQLAELKSKLGATEATLKAVNEIRVLALAASAANADAFADLRTIAGTCVRSIKAFADASANPSAVYQLAALPSPLPPGPASLPNTGTDFSATLNLSTGGLALKWKVVGGAQPYGVSGVVWNVRRSINGGTPVSIGLTGEKSFIDGTIPADAITCAYTVTPQHGQQVGPISGTFQVRFTPAAGNGNFEVAGVKMAA